MKTYTASIPGERHQRERIDESSIPSMKISTREILALLSAATVAINIVLLFVLAAGSAINDVIGAATLGTGFVFLALAVDSRHSTAILQSLTGLALLVMAWLQANVATDFVVASGVLLAAWVATLLFRHLR